LGAEERIERETNGKPGEERSQGRCRDDAGAQYLLRTTACRGWDSAEDRTGGGLEARIRDESASIRVYDLDG